MTAKEMVENYEISLRDNNTNLKIRDTKEAREDFEEIKARKAEIIDYLLAVEAEKEAAKEEREEKIASIEGLNELQKAIEAEETYRYELNNRFEDESLSSLPVSPPKTTAKDVAKKYPKAAAYVKAESWTHTSNYVKAAAGEKAVERIINGDDHEQVLKDMEAEWSAYCDKHVWD